jgi:GntR family transcriptional regulator
LRKRIEKSLLRQQFQGGNMTKEFIALDDSKNALPLHVQLKEFLRNQIENNEYQCWDVIPSETELQQIFNVSRTTVRQAITDLTNEGYLIKKQG